MLHVECRDVGAAERLLRVGVAAGFRESGISLGKKRVLAAIRTGADSLEAPVVLGGQLLLTEPGLGALVALANTKFGLNAERTERLEEVSLQICGEWETLATKIDFNPHICVSSGAPDGLFPRAGAAAGAGEWERAGGAGGGGGNHDGAAGAAAGKGAGRPKAKGGGRAEGQGSQGSRSPCLGVAGAFDQGGESAGGGGGGGGGGAAGGCWRWGHGRRPRGRDGREREGQLAAPPLIGCLAATGTRGQGGPSAGSIPWWKSQWTPRHGSC